MIKTGAPTDLYLHFFGPISDRDRIKFSKDMFPV